tara:strand:- start:5067 stop:7253 length:2187 start_codon:yes stop_codon:yes gene_type:complete
MALPAILPIIKTLISQLGKKAIMSKAKNELKDKAKNFIQGKKKKDQPVELGKQKISSSFVRSYSDVREAEPRRISSSLISSTSSSPSSNNQTPKRISYDKLTESISNIVKITSDLNNVTKKQLERDKRIAKDKRKREQEQARKKREALLESGKKTLVGAAGTVGAAANKFNILDFFTAILLGGAALALINAFKTIKENLKLIQENALLIYLALTKGIPALLQIAKNIGKVFTNLSSYVLGKLGKLISPLVDTAKSRLDKVIKNVVSTIKTFGRNLITRILNLADDVGRGALKSVDAAKKFLQFFKNKIPPSVRNFVAKGVFDAKLAGRSAQKGAARGVSKITKPVVKGGKFLAKFLPSIAKPIAEVVSKNKDTFKALKVGAKNLKVPILGPLIVFGAGLLDPDETFAESSIKALSTLIGGLALSPLGPLGMIVGELLGEQIGELVYTATMTGEGGLERAKQQLIEKGQKILTGATAAFDWVKNGFTRFFGALPKVPVFGYEIPVINPLRLDLIGTLFMRAFFSKNEMPSPDDLPTYVLDPGDKPEDTRKGRDSKGYENKLAAWNVNNEKYQNYKKEMQNYYEKLGLTKTGVEPQNELIPTTDTDTTPKYFESGGRYYAMDESQKYLGDTEEKAMAALGIEPSQEQEDMSSEAQIDRNVTPAISETTSKVEQSASYEESEEEVIVTVPATQQQQSQPMMRSKSRVVMVGGDSVDRYYRSQLLGSLYKRG